MLRIGYVLVLFCCIFPILPGMLGLIAPSLNYIPALGLHDFSFSGFRAVFAWPSVSHSIVQTIFTAIISTLMASLIAFLIIQTYWGKRSWHKVEHLLSPLLALPHVAFAVGFLFLFSNTGWLARGIYFIAHDVFSLSHQTAQSIYKIQDHSVIGLTFALAIKETPFLLLMSIPILNNLNVSQCLRVSQSLGYSVSQTWWKVIFPQWWRHMRFPLFSIMAYSASVVDVSLILGPTHIPTFAVLIWQWFNEPDLELLPRAAAGAFLLFVLCSLLIGLVWLLERVFLSCYRSWMTSGCQLSSTSNNARFQYIFHILATISLFTLAVILVWTFALRWKFPDFLPTFWSLRFWQSEWPYIQSTIFTSFSLALVSSFLALLLAITALEYRQHYRLSVPLFVIALPMLLPQLSLLFGLQITSLWFDPDSYWLWVMWSHVFFAFPYVYLSLDGPWQSYPTRLSQTAVSLGFSPFKTFTTVKLRTLAGAIAFAWAMGASVSLAQYLPTLMLGSGRVTTLTTEAVALSSGQDRRITALYALWQAILPFGFFVSALIMNRHFYRRMKGSQSENQKGQMTV
ncbi:MAG: ABC transporter permease [Vibrio sp.]